MESRHGFCVSLLCGNACANAGCERGPQKLLKTCYTLAMPLSVEQLFCGLGQRQFILLLCLSDAWCAPVLSQGEGGPLPSLNIYLEAGSESA